MGEELIKYGEIMRTYELEKDKQQVENIKKYYTDLLGQYNIEPIFNIEEDKSDIKSLRYSIETAYVLNLYIKKEDISKTKSILKKYEQKEDIEEFESNGTKKMKQYVKYFITLIIAIAMMMELAVLIEGINNVTIAEIVLLSIFFVAEIGILFFFWRKRK